MAPRTRPVDVVFVGGGLTMSIIADELTDAGLNVLALERGPRPDAPADRGSAGALAEDLSGSTLTFRNAPSQTALPVRKPAALPPEAGVGGSETAWTGRIWRSLPADFRMRSHNLERYGASALPEDAAVQDWPISYDELEPCYDKFEYVFGVCGRAGNLQGRIQPGGNPFEGPRRRDYPTPPTDPAYAPALFGKAAAELGRHPFPAPSPGASPWTALLPVLTRKPNFALKTGCEVLKINTDSERGLATGVTYLDLAAGRELFQPAAIVVLSASSLNNVRLLLLSGVGQPYDIRTGQGVIGRNYAHPILSEVDVFFEDELMDPSLAPGAHAVAVDDFNGDNFDHAGKGFIGGGHIRLRAAGARPIESAPAPPGTPRWGAEWKKAAAHWRLRSASIRCHGGVTSRPTNFLDLDPTYRDAWERPLLRVTFDFPDNDRRMSAHLTARAVEIGRAMGAVHVRSDGPNIARSHAPGRTAYDTGGAVMGEDPKSSAVNRYLQSWDVCNLFVTGAATLPQSPGCDPCGTVGALAYWCADAIKSRYLKSPGPMVSA
jgi:gluconate 2-dehydrogenase alpha chain